MKKFAMFVTTMFVAATCQAGLPASVAGAVAGLGVISKVKSETSKSKLQKNSKEESKSKSKRI
jgi:hypothetical protein